MSEISEEEPVVTFQMHAAEGDIMAKQGDFRKAIECYGKALAMNPTEKNILVARSRCYLQVGNPQAALADADTALKEDKEFFKARYQKAEALYARGDFEMALVYYHRGYALRPELDEFRLGIQKAREAIDNSIGKKIEPKDYKNEIQRVDSKAIQGIFISPEQAAANSNGSSPKSSDSRAATAHPGGTVLAPSLVSPTSTYAPSSLTSDRSVKQLLGELHEDKEFLEDMLNDKDFEINPNPAIRQLIVDGLRFLDSRIEFWRQQKPLYARKKEITRIRVNTPPSKTIASPRKLVI